MTLSELSIRRPVFATVLSLLLLIVGIMAALRLSIREYPDVSQPVVSISVNYRGANAATIETRVTQVIENEVAGLEGVDKLTSQSRDENASVNVQFTANRDVDDAANDVRDRVSRVVARLPQEADAPQIQKTDSGSDPVLIVIISSNKRTALELTDYAERNLVDRISSVPGVANVFLNGGRRFAMRIWLDRGALAARQIAVTDIENALRNENVELPAGRIESEQREFTLRTDTSLRSEERFPQPGGRAWRRWLPGAAGRGGHGAAGCREPAQRRGHQRRAGHTDAGGGTVDGQRAGGGVGDQEGNQADPRGIAPGHQR